MENKPQKRCSELQFLSREHHHGLLLSWKIRTGFKKGRSERSIHIYAHWFYIHHLLPHFAVEEEFIFPILGEGEPLIMQALNEHLVLKNLFESDAINKENLLLIADKLEAHIRFEERVLFGRIQEIATEEQLRFITTVHNEEKFVDNMDDPFWL